MEPILFFSILVGIAIVSGIVRGSLKSSKKPRSKRHLARASMAKVDQMKGSEFEHFLAATLKKLGYKVSVTKASGDFGADLILWKNNKKIIVQAKRYKNKVPIKAVQEVVGAKAYYQADEVWAITNNYFTEPAKKLADVNGVKLIEREKLIKMILNSKQKK